MRSAAERIARRVAPAALGLFVGFFVYAEMRTWDTSIGPSVGSSTTGLAVLGLFGALLVAASLLGGIALRLLHADRRVVMTACAVAVGGAAGTWRVFDEWLALYVTLAASAVVLAGLFFACGGRDVVHAGVSLCIWALAGCAAAETAVVLDESRLVDEVSHDALVEHVGPEHPWTRGHGLLYQPDRGLRWTD